MSVTGAPARGSRTTNAPGLALGGSVVGVAAVRAGQLPDDEEPQPVPPVAWPVENRSKRRGLHLRGHAGAGVPHRDHDVVAVARRASPAPEAPRGAGRW